MPVALVQEADAASSSVTLGSATTAGNTVLVAVACLGPTSATGVTGITLGGSPDNFALITPGPSAQDTTSPNDWLNVSVWADANCATGTAVAVTGTGVQAVWAWEFSGLAGMADIAQVLAVGTYQDSWLASAAQTTVPAEAWIAVIAAANQTATETISLTSGNGWATETAYGGTSGSYDWGALSGYQTVNTVGTPSFNGSFSQPSFSVTVIVTLGAGIPPVAAVANAPLTGNVTVHGDLAARGALKSAGVITQGGRPVGLTPVGPITGNYTAKPGDFVLANCSSGAFTITLPATPANGSLVGVKLLDNLYGPMTVQASGLDVIDYIPGATWITPTVTGSVFVLQYQTTTATWYTQSTGTQLPQTAAMNSPQPADVGFAAWSYDYAMLSGTFAGAALPSSGNAYLVKCPVRATAPFLHLRYWITAAGSGLTAGENFIGIYSSSGTKICATTNQTAIWGSSTGQLDWSFTGNYFLASPPFMWVAFLCNGTTGPSLACTGNQTAAWANGNLSASPRFGTYNVAGTALPSSLNTQFTSTAAAEYWVGLY